MKKVLSILLAAVMLFTMIPANVFAAEGTTVKLVSFMRGDVDDLRSSELLEVQVEGYEGNPRELTYKWTSSLGTYLYIYNSHNMYGINNTYGEMEIYNTDKNVKRSSNVEEDRSGNKTLTKEGFMWASVYGAYEYSKISASTALKGTVTVEVFDKNGKSLGSDSFSSFKAHNLDYDLDNVVIGLFEGDRKNVLDLLGESGIVHITCDQSKVSSAEIIEGDKHIAIESEKKDKNTYNYYIKGVKAGNNSTNGDAQLEINIKKTSCKFHYSTSGTAQPIVYVFKKPTTTTTTTTLILNKDSIDERCEYFIDGNKGEGQPDGTIVFTGLTPNTDYTVEVRAEYKDGDETKYVYSYVDDTTKPVYSAKIYTYLDSVLTEFENIYGNGSELLIREDNPYTEYISLSETTTGIYVAPLYNAVFNPWYKVNGVYNKIGNYQLVIENANAELHLHHYSVKYDTNGGAFKVGEEVGTEVYAARDAVNATSNIPVREGFIFTGWEYSGKVIGTGKQITSSITAPITLKAKWEKAVNVTINVTIDHNSKVDTGFDQVDSKAEVFVKLLEKKAGSPGFVEIGDKLYFTKDGVTDINGNKKSYDYSIKDNVSTYTATADTYTGLLDTSSFDVAVSKTDYDVTKVEKVIDENGDCTINVFLKYNPSNFDLKFSLEMAEDVPAEAYPDAAIVKVAFWNGSAWEIITQQAGADRPGTRVNIDPVTGEGSGSYPVWKFADDDEPYGNRIVVTGFIYGDSVITAPVESIDGLIATYSDGYYTATMTDVTDGKKYGEQLYGAYYDKDTNGQKGTLHGVISVEKYDVTFNANGCTVNGKAVDVAKQKYCVPSFADYKPNMDGHNFLGWYTEDGTPVTEGEVLTKDITLYAKWDQILTGNVRVAGSYMQDGHKVDVWAVDRANSAVIVLEEITADGEYIVDSQTVNIVWPMADMIYGISEEYKFTGLDPEKNYRTEVLILNYGTTYQNSTTKVINDGDYANDYNADDFTAVYPESSKWETFVNAYLSFEPASYFQPVEVDATLIGENLRPDDTLVEIWYKATGTDNAYQVISQHTVVPYGIEIGMGKDGKDDGDYGYTVWNSVYNGNLYDYQAYLSKIENDKASEWPVSVVYGAPSRYSPLNNAPTGVLQVKIIPNTYSIIFNEIYESEDVSVVSYGAHTWSYETAIDYVPVRDGYAFEGWYSNPECTGEKVTAIAETVAEDTELYAKWKRLTTPVEPLDSVSYIVEHYKENADGTYSIAEEDTEILSGKIGATVIATAKTYEGYCFNEAQSEATASGVLKAISSADDILTLKLYYDIDNAGGGENGDEGDGIADKYQKKVIFKVVNGIWADGTTVNKVVYLELMKNGEYAIDGAASLTTPADMVANEGYKNGSWDKEIPSIVSGTETLTFTYSFVRSTTPIEPLDSVKYIVEHYKENADGTYSIVEEDTEILSGKIGATVTAIAKTYEGYCLNEIKSEATASGVLKAISNASDILILKLYYDVDSFGDGENGDEGDGTPDKYQKKVIFKVVNGTWADGTTVDKVVYLDLMKDGEYAVDGTASLTVPTGMIANEGFKNGSWDKEIPVIVSSTETEIFTYSFEKINDLTLTVKYVDKSDNFVLEAVIIDNITFGTSFAASEFKKSFTGYSYDSVNAESVVVSTGKNEIILYYTKNTYDYTVNYYKAGTTESVAPSVTGAAPYGTTVKENAIAIKGYTVSGESEKAITIDTENNVINFYYTVNVYGYTVNYLEKGTNKVLATAKTGSANFGTEVIEKAIDIKGYTLDGDNSRSIVIDTENNVINFYYTVNSYNYKVNYLEKDTNKVIATPRTRASKFGETVNETAKEVRGYTLVGDNIQSIKIDTANNVINFYYTVNTYGYKVNYLEKGTNKVLAEAKTGTKNYGENVTETAIAIKGYALDGDNSRSIVIDTENNVINFYYTVNSYIYKVNYLEKGTDRLLTPSKTGTKNYGEKITESAKSITGYSLVGNNTQTITIDTANNVINFYYTINSYEYKVNYLEKGTNKVIAAAKTGTKNYGEKVTETAIEVKGYVLADEAEKSIVIDTKNNVIKFYYTSDGTVPDTPDVPGGEGEGEGNGSLNGGAHHILFGKTDGIGWYKVSKDGGQTWDTVFGNSTYEVEHGTEIIVRVGDLAGENFTFYVNGEKHHPDENGNLVITVDGYMLIGAIGIDPDVDFEVPDVEESLNWFQKIIKAIKDFFAKLFGKN